LSPPATAALLAATPTPSGLEDYLLWTALAATSVTSSLFLTALAPNLLAIEFIRKSTSLEITWTQWFLVVAPGGVVLLLALPVPVYWLYPPSIAEGGQAPGWAGRELNALGSVSPQDKKCCSQWRRNPRVRSSAIGPTSPVNGGANRADS
jgi:L-tartrate/succinate antiporter